MIDNRFLSIGFEHPNGQTSYCNRKIKTRSFVTLPIKEDLTATWLSSGNIELETGSFGMAMMTTTKWSGREPGWNGAVPSPGAQRLSSTSKYELSSGDKKAHLGGVRKWLESFFGRYDRPQIRRLREGLAKNWVYCATGCR